MEEDPEFHRIIKIYLTTELKDEDDKKRVFMPFGLFYEFYK